MYRIISFRELNIVYRIISWDKCIATALLTKQFLASLSSCGPLFKEAEATEKSAEPSAEKYDLQLAFGILCALQSFNLRERENKQTNIYYLWGPVEC